MPAVFTIAVAPNEVFGHGPESFGLKSTGNRPAQAAAGSFLIQLEDGSGYIELESNTGRIELENGP